jgi:glycosyltransferase involved in cell wall biosynthesis
LPFEDSPIGRLTALAYREASVVIITNADNGRAARRLGVTDFRFVPHPVNEQEPNARAVDALRAELRRQLDADFLLFHPSRQHWAPWRDPHLEKGNDRLIEALARFFHDRPRAAAVFVRWGATQEASQALLSERGIARRVHWIDPVPGPALARHMAAADVVADQFYLGAFGAITPRALSLGTPPLLHLDLEAHRWALDEPPPVMNACAPDEILALLKRGYDDREWLADLGRRGRAWYARFHSNEVVRRALLDAYAAVLG